MRNDNSNYNFVAFAIIIALALVLVLLLVWWQKRELLIDLSVTTAILGIVASALITLLLLRDQTKNEERQDRNIRMFQKKLEVYSSFNSILWSADLDMKQINQKFFQEIVFCMEPSDIDKTQKLLLALKKTIDDDNAMQKHQLRNEITSILRMELDGKLLEGLLILDGKSRADEEEFPTEACNQQHEQQQANPTSDQVQEEAHEPVSLPKDEPINATSTEKPDSLAVKCFNGTFWHFNMWGSEQLTALCKGIYELNLVEYGEDWRTGLIKQVNENDLVFLFRRGGAGYMGVYRAIGRKVFEFNPDGTTVEKLHIFGTPEQEKEPTEEELANSDIYESKEDGATLCASILVEPLAFASTGVGNAGGTYRRTISRYYRDYGLWHLARFMAVMDDEKVFNIFYEEGKKYEMGCNKELLQQILAAGDIKPAQRDENGNWFNDRPTIINFKN